MGSSQGDGGMQGPVGDGGMWDPAMGMEGHQSLA